MSCVDGVGSFLKGDEEGVDLGEKRGGGRGREERRDGNVLYEAETDKNIKLLKCALCQKLKT